MDTRDIPVIINNRNRLTTLKALVTWLEKAGMRKIVVIDNASTYPPLLSYYLKFPHSLCMLRDNVGYLALWEAGTYREFAGAHFFYTDSDVVPVEECPPDFADYLFAILERYPSIEKVGLGLVLDDIPDANRAKGEILARERPFWKRAVAKGVFDALVDTTFALYRPFARGGYWARAYRTGPPYVARHLPWYVDSGCLSDEEIYYRSHATSDSYWSERS